MFAGCRRVGNTQKLGAMLGILRAIGAYVPEPGSVAWTFFMLIQRIFTTVFGAQHDTCMSPMPSKRACIFPNEPFSAAGILGQIFGTKQD